MEDVLIIGAGPIGLACGIEAQKRGLSYRIIDKGTLVNSLYNYPLGMTFFSTSDKLEIGGVPFISHGHKPTRSEALEYYRRVAMHFDLKIQLYETVEAVELTDGIFQVSTSKGKYSSTNVVLATGFYDLPNKMGVPGEELDKVKHYYREPHPYYGQEVAIVGASNSAVDAALECYRKGARVTMIVRGEGIGERVKYWVRPDVVNRIAEGSIQAHFNSEVIQVDEETITFASDGNKHVIQNDFVLALTGYQPNFNLLKSMGITIENNPEQIPSHNRETMESNIQGLYLAGVICGGLKTNKWFIENSRIHAEVIMKQISRKLELV